MEQERDLKIERLAEEFLADNPDVGRIDERDFYDVYGKTEVENDIANSQVVSSRIKRRVEEMPSAVREEYEKVKKTADALEIIIMRGADDFVWFNGGSVDTYYSRTAKYDDYNGTDGVMEFLVGEHETVEEQDVKRVAIAVDASSGSDYETISKKINRNLEAFLGRNNETIALKYFESQLTDKKGRLTQVLPVVIGTDARNTTSLMEDILRYDKVSKMAGSGSPEAKGLLNKLASHPVQRIYIEEIAMQIEMYDRLYDEVPDANFIMPREELAKIGDIVNEIRESKQDISVEGLKHDQVLKRIIRYTNDI